MTPLVTCMKCPHAGPCAGPCPCDVDAVDIQHHAASCYCPDPAGPRYGDGVKPAEWGLMEFVARPPAVIPEGYEATAENAISGGCGCDGSS